MSIKQPGIYRLSEDVYHSDPCPCPSLSASIASILVDDCPASAWQAHPRLNPAVQPEEKDIFDLGSAAHEMFLEQGDERIVVCNYSDWRTNAAKEEKAAARASGKYPLLKCQLPRVRAMADAARSFINTTELAGILDEGAPEQAVIWQEGNTWFRSKTDWLRVRDGRTFVLDYKTTELTKERWCKTIGSSNRDVQAVLYPRGLSALSFPKPEFIWLVQQVFAPHACWLVGMSAQRKEMGEAKLRRAIRLWKQCMSSAIWPAYGTAISYSEPETFEVYQHDKLLEQEQQEVSK